MSSKKDDKYLVFRFDDGRIRKFKWGPCYELVNGNGMAAGQEVHMFEVPFEKTEAKRRIE